MNKIGTKNMKKPNILLYTIIATLLYTTSCTEQDNIENLSADNASPKKCMLDLKASCAEYDVQTTRTATSTAWKTGDIIYFTFDNNAYGMATYNNTAQWEIEYFGTIPQNIESECKAVYFVNPKSREHFQAVNLTHETAIYEDTLATYQFDGSLLTITANLQPKTGRIRFKGNLRDTIYVYGLNVGTRYSVFKGEYADTITFVQLITKSDGYTPYIYGEFPDSTSHRLNIATSTSAYTRVFPDSVMNKGQSGWLSIPTDNYHTAWQNKMIFKVKTTEFAMIPVTEYSHLSFLIGETEVTKGLHNAVTDSIIIRSNYPQSFYTYQAATDFITQLNVALGINFTLPTQKQWEWAYKGGEKSLKYTYSGSNVASEVGWDKDNSGGKAHKVSTLMPNELGLYDMYGNLGEWYLCEDYYLRSYQTSRFNTINTGTDYVKGIYTNVSNIGVRLKLSF